MYKRFKETRSVDQQKPPAGFFFFLWLLAEITGLFCVGPQLPCVCCWCWQSTAETLVMGCTDYAGRAILEEEPFMGIPAYCASFCLIYIWHGKFHLKW